MQQAQLAFEHELVIDLFAGGGGASEAMKEELGREPDIAINHDEWAILMHAVNHPTTKHFRKDVYEVDPIIATGGRPVGLLHASPDCTHHSQAKGGQPRRKEIRSLSWVVHKWAGKTKPRCITLENVEQILKWSPLIAKRDKETGRVIKLDRTVAAPGERVPVREQFLVPDPERVGQNWRHWVRGLERMGYVVRYGKLRSHDHGAGTSRERLFVMARRDGLPIEWPKATHSKQHKRLKPIVRAADCIDFGIPCPSIFSRQKPLVDATLRRIAKGTVRYVLDCADPFIVPATHSGSDRVHSVNDALRTITTAQRGEFMLCAPMLTKVNSHGWDRDGGPINPADAPFGTIIAKDSSAVVAPVLVSVAHGDSGGRREYPVTDPLGTVSGRGVQHAIMAAHLTKFRTGAVGTELHDPMPTICAGGAMKRPAGAAHAMGIVTAFMEQAHEALPGRDARDPVSTIVGKGCTQRLVTAHTVKLKGTSKHGQPLTDALHTIAAQGTHHALVEYELSPEAEAGALRVAAFLISYYSEGGGQSGSLRNAMGAITTKDRIALVTVSIQGVPYVIVDIGLRMLTPRELFRAQGFPDSYIIDRTADGRPISKTNQVRMVGNSVSPPPYRALLRANFKHEKIFTNQREAA